MFSVTPRSSATSPIRTEPSRNSASDASARPNGFAALVDVNARTQTEPLRPATTDRRDPHKRRPTRRARTATRRAMPRRTHLPRHPTRARTSKARRPAKIWIAQRRNQRSRQRPAKPPATQPIARRSKPRTPMPRRLLPGVPTDPTAVAVALTASPSVAATPDPATSSGASGPATAAP